MSGEAHIHIRNRRVSHCCGDIPVPFDRFDLLACGFAGALMLVIALGV
jgi:hypothetical protein